MNIACSKTDERDPKQETNNSRWLPNIVSLGLALGREIRIGSRRLFNNPRFATTTVLLLVIGVGANITIFNLIYALAIRKLPATDPDQLVSISFGGPADEFPLSGRMFEGIQLRQQVFSAMMAWCHAYVHTVLDDGETRQVVSGVVASGNTFALLGTHVVRGRAFNTLDDSIGGGPNGWVAVITHKFWRDHYHGDPSVIGRQIKVSNQVVTIIGILDQGFTGVTSGEQVDIMLPLNFQSAIRGADPDYHRPIPMLFTMGRLKPGVTVAQAASNVQTIERAVLEEALPPELRNMEPIRSFHLLVKPNSTGWSTLRGRYERPLLLLQALVGLILLMCCINIGGIFIYRSLTRGQEASIRVALGASRSHLIRQSIIESLLVGPIAGVLALGFAWVASTAVVNVLALHVSVVPNIVVFSVALTIALVTVMLCSAISTIVTTRGGVFCALRSTPSMGGTRRKRMGDVIISAEIALSMTLLILCGLFSLNLARIVRTNPGFRSDGVLVGGLHLGRRPETGDALVQLYRNIVKRVGDHPGVGAVAVSEIGPISGERHLVDVSNEENSAEDKNIYANDIGPRYFDVLGIPVIAGREFTDSDSTHAETCIVNEMAAKFFYPNQNPVGRSVRGRGEGVPKLCQIVGLVGDARYATMRDPAPRTIYFPYSSGTGQLGAMHILIRADQAQAAETSYRAALRQLAPDAPANPPTLLADTIEDSLATERLLTILSSGFAFVALLLTCVAVYEIVGQSISTSKTEIGVRVAVGAQRRDIVKLFLARPAALATIGILGGCIISLVALEWVKAHLAVYIASFNLLVCGSGVAFLLLVAVGSAMVAIRSALAINPSVALRNE